MFAPFFTANDVYDDVFYCYDMGMECWVILHAWQGYQGFIQDFLFGR